MINHPARGAPGQTVQLFTFASVHGGDGATGYFAQESRSVTVRLNTGAPGFESTRSATK
jgi:hypothetical protein